MSTVEIDPPCVGVCMVDASGYCLGCGRPPLSVRLPAADDGDATLMAARADSITCDGLQAVTTLLANALSTRLTQ